MPDIKILVIVDDISLPYREQYKLFSDPEMAIEHAQKHGYGTGMLGMSFLGGELKPGMANIHQSDGPKVTVIALEVQEKETTPVHVAISQHSYDSPPEILGVYRTEEGAIRKVHEQFMEGCEADEMMDPEIWGNYEEVVISGERLVKSYQSQDDGGGTWVETHPVGN